MNTINVNYKGLVSLQATSSGSELFDESTLSLYLQDGPTMYTTSSDVYPFAYYADDKTGYPNYSAIVWESYGSGKVLLSGPHQELDPENSQLLAKMILWTVNDSG